MATTDSNDHFDRNNETLRQVMRLLSGSRSSTNPNEDGLSKSIGHNCPESLAGSQQARVKTKNNIETRGVVTNTRTVHSTSPICPTLVDSNDQKFAQLGENNHAHLTTGSCTNNTGARSIQNQVDFSSVSKNTTLKGNMLNQKPQTPNLQNSGKSATNHQNTLLEQMLSNVSQPTVANIPFATQQPSQQSIITNSIAQYLLLKNLTNQMPVNCPNLQTSLGINGACLPGLLATENQTVASHNNVSNNLDGLNLLLGLIGRQENNGVHAGETRSMENKMSKQAVKPKGLEIPGFYIKSILSEAEKCKDVGSSGSSGVSSTKSTGSKSSQSSLPVSPQCSSSKSNSDCLSDSITENEYIDVEDTSISTFNAFQQSLPLFPLACSSPKAPIDPSTQLRTSRVVNLPPTLPIKPLSSQQQFQFNQNFQNFNSQNLQQTLSLSGMTGHINTLGQVEQLGNPTKNSPTRYNCKQCDMKFTSLSLFKQHIRTHELPCQCPICNKAFSRPWLLQCHLRTHTGEKPYKCTVCNRAFADRSNMRSHAATHDKTRPFICSCCNKTFSRKSGLTKHIKQVHEKIGPIRTEKSLIK